MDIYLKGLLTGLLSFVAVLVYARILNKEQLSQLTFYDYIAGITLGSIAGTMALDIENRIWHHLWVLTVFAGATYVFGLITEKSRPLRKLIEGEPTVVIHNGRVLEHNMARLRYNLDNLLTQLRDKSVFNISDVEFAVLESNGGLSVLLKSQKRPVQPADLNIPTSYEGIPAEIIVDGMVVYENLKQNKLDEQWLISELKKRGYNSPRQIVYASLNVDGSLYIDDRNDKTENMVDISD
ncbi:MAG: DUF421 domain-containing protein [Chitinophagales bacterium]